METHTRSNQAYSLIYFFGHDFSIASRTALSDFPSATQAVISFQNDPAPTAAGITSEPSKRKVVAFFRI